MSLTLSDIAEKVLTKQGQEAVEERLATGEEEKAREYLLGAVDHLFETGELLEEEARRYYEVLKVPPERASALRQSRDQN